MTLDQIADWVTSKPEKKQFEALETVTVYIRNYIVLKNREAIADQVSRNPKLSVTSNAASGGGAT